MRRLGIAAVAFAVLAALFLTAHRRRMRAEASLLELRARREALLREARKADLAAGARLAPASAVFVDSSVRPGASGGPLGLLEHSPRLQADYFAAHRANLPFLYGPLFRAWHLSAEQASQLTDLIEQHDEEFFDTVAATPAALHQTHYFGNSPFVRQNFALSTGGEWGAIAPSTEEESAALAYLAQSDAQFKSAVAGIAGPEAYPALQQYQATVQYREMVDQVGVAMAAAGIPLTDEQTSQLCQICAQSTRMFADGVDLPTAVASAEKILSPDQLSILKTQVAVSQAQTELYKAIRSNGGFGVIQKLACIHHKFRRILPNLVGENGLGLPALCGEHSSVGLGRFHSTILGNLRRFCDGCRLAGPLLPP